MTQMPVDEDLDFLISSPIPDHRRQRDWRSIRRSSERIRCSQEFVGLCLLFLIVVGTNGQQQHHFGFCFSSLKQADSDDNLKLSPAEYETFVSAFSNGAVSQPLPTTLLEPYQMMTIEAKSTGELPIDGVEGSIGSDSSSFVMRLCHKVKASLMGYFGVTIIFDSCLGALRTADTVTPSGYLSPDPEYVQFMIAISGGSLKDIVVYEDLPRLVKYTFLDMAINGMIAGPEGTDYLQEFCERALLSSVMETKIEILETKAPKATDAPSLAPVGLGEIDDPLVAHVSSTTANATLELTDEEISSCLKDIRLSDIDRNDLLERREFGSFVNRLYKQVFGSSFQGSNEAVIDEAYQEILADQDKRVAASIAGSKPGRLPTRKEKKMLKFICTTAHKAIRIVHTSETIDAEDGTVLSTETAPDTAFDKFFPTCKVSMFASDQDKDSRLNQAEFAKLITRLARTEDVEYRSMDDIFKRCFREVSKGGSIDISGSSPVAVTSILQHARLQSVCKKIESTIAEYRQEHDLTSTGSLGQEDVLVQSIDLQNEFPDLTEEFFRLCTMAMYIADHNHDDMLSQSEFITFVGRLTFDNTENRSYQDLHEVFRGVLSELSNADGFIDISGTRPGRKPNYDEEKRLRRVCNHMSGAIVDSEGSITSQTEEVDPNDAGNSTPHEISDTQDTDREYNASMDGMPQSKTPQANATSEHTQRLYFSNETYVLPDEMSITKFSRCQNKISKADEDGDSFLNEDEYFTLLKLLGKDAVNFSSFEALPVALQRPFLSLAIDQAEIGVYGSHIGDKATELNIGRLEGLCSDIFDSIFYFSKGGDLYFNCLASMRVADQNEDEALDKTEFIRFLNVWTRGRFQGLTFSELPYALASQFNWSSVDDMLSIRGSALSGAYVRDVNNVNQFCERAENSFQSPTPAMSLAQYCRQTLTEADANGDGIFTKREYISFVSLFTGNLLKPPSRFIEMNTEFQQLYETNIGQSGSMELKRDTTKFCDDLETSIVSVTRKVLYSNLCRTSFLSGDHDADGRLSPDEFASVMLELSFHGSTARNQPKFDDFGDEIHRSFRTMSNGEFDIDLLPFTLVDSEVDEHVQGICNEVFEIIVPQLQSCLIPVYNSFLIASTNTTSNATLGSEYERVVLEKAFFRFAGTHFGRRRKTLEVAGIAPASVSVDLIEPTDCPSSIDSFLTQCEVVFAHFYSISFGDFDEIALSADISEQLQNYIDSGELQKQLLSIDPQFRARVLRSSLPLKPGPRSTENVEESVILESGTLMLIMMTASSVMVFIGMGCFYGRRLGPRHKLDVALIKGDKGINELNIADEDKLAPEEQRKKEDYQRLKEYIVPLLLSRAYHLPGYSYAEDLFQYLYNRHPILGLFWRHPLHPIGTKVRLVCLVGSVCFGLAISNLIFIAFWFSGLDFDKNYAALVTQDMSIRGSLDTEVAAATTAFSIGNLALWTVGSAIHAIFDSTLWSMALCSCMSQRGIIEQLQAYKRVGAMSLSLYVTGVAIIAIVTVGVRISLNENEDSASAQEAATETFADYEFTISYALEVFISFFFFFPLFGFIMFSGFLRCCPVPMFGGRRLEMVSRQEDDRRHDRLEKRKLKLTIDENSDPNRHSATVSTLSTAVSGIQVSAGESENQSLSMEQSYGYDDDGTFYDNKSMAKYQPSSRNRMLDCPSVIMENESYHEDMSPHALRKNGEDNPKQTQARPKPSDDTEIEELDSISAMNIAENFLKLLMGDDTIASERNSSTGSHTDEDGNSDVTKDRSVRKKKKPSIASGKKLEKHNDILLRSEQRIQIDKQLDQQSESSSDEPSLAIKDVFSDTSLKHKREKRGSGKHKSKGKSEITSSDEATLEIRDDLSTSSNGSSEHQTVGSRKKRSKSIRKEKLQNHDEDSGTESDGKVDGKVEYANRSRSQGSATSEKGILQLTDRSENSKREKKNLKSKHGADVESSDSEQGDWSMSDTESSTVASIKNRLSPLQQTKRQSPEPDKKQSSSKLSLNRLKDTLNSLRDSLKVAARNRADGTSSVVNQNTSSTKLSTPDMIATSNIGLQQDLSGLVEPRRTSMPLLISTSNTIQPDLAGPRRTSMPASMPTSNEIQQGPPQLSLPSMIRTTADGFQTSSSALPPGPYQMSSNMLPPPSSEFQPGLHVPGSLHRSSMPGMIPTSPAGPQWSTMPGRIPVPNSGSQAGWHNQFSSPQGRGVPYNRMGRQSPFRGRYMGGRVALSGRGNWPSYGPPGTSFPPTGQWQPYAGRMGMYNGGRVQRRSVGAPPNSGGRNPWYGPAAAAGRRHSMAGPIVQYYHPPGRSPMSMAYPPQYGNNPYGHGSMPNMGWMPHSSGYGDRPTSNLEVPLTPITTATSMVPSNNESMLTPTSIKND